MPHSADNAGPRFFFSVGDHSADQHGARLIQSIRQRCPDARFEGFGGDLMKEAGCDLHFPLCDLAVMGLIPVLKNLRTFLRLKKQTDRHFKENPPDALILLDYPGFNLKLAKSAKKLGIPVYYFIPPQAWAWRPWRVKKVRRVVDHIFSCLTFEQKWYEERNVSSTYVGHPYFDQFRDSKLDGHFVASQQSHPGPIIGLLPGSRDQELKHHAPILFDTAAKIHQQRPDVRFLVACLKEQQAAGVRQRWQQWCEAHPELNLSLDIFAGRTSEIIHVAHSCVSKSGSVSLELLYRSTPTVIVYQGHKIDVMLAKLVMTCPYITLVNLLADRELFPEHLTAKLSPDVLAGQVLNWLQNPREHENLRGELDRLCDEVVVYGACDNVAEGILERMQMTQTKRAA